MGLSPHQHCLRWQGGPVGCTGQGGPGSAAAGAAALTPSAACCFSLHLIGHVTASLAKGSLRQGWSCRCRCRCCWGVGEGTQAALWGSVAGGHPIAHIYTPHPKSVWHTPALGQRTVNPQRQRQGTHIRQHTPAYASPRATDCNPSKAKAQGRPVGTSQNPPAHRDSHPSFSFAKYGEVGSVPVLHGGWPVDTAMELNSIGGYPTNTRFCT